MEVDLLSRIEERQVYIMQDIKYLREVLQSHMSEDREALSTIYDKMNAINVESSGQFGKIKGIGLVLVIAIPIVTTILVTVITYLLNHVK